MAKRLKHKPTLKQQKNMQFSEERFELLDTIHDMIEDELNRRGMVKKNKPLMKSEVAIPPPKNSSASRTLWQCIKDWWKGRKNKIPIDYIKY